jgi:heme exporter protein B
VNALARLVARDLRLAWSGGGIVNPVAFFLLVAILFPFAIGPDAALLARVGGGVIWAAALLAALLPVERLIGPDAEAGVFDQLSVRGFSMSGVAAARMLAHWLAFAPPLMLAAVVAAGLLGLPGGTLGRVELGLLIGTPGLAALAVATSALIAGLRGAGALAGLLMLPLAVPLLIFGGGALDPAAGAGALKLLGAVSLVLVAGAPFVAGAAMRVAME